MRKVIFESAVSADGFIEGPNGEFDWRNFHEGYNSALSFLSRFDTIFFGRKAYERFAVADGAEQLSAEQRKFLEGVRYMRKYVFSRVQKHVPGNGMVVSENIAAEVTRIREEEGKNIWFCGGADILRTFADLDLVDEYILTIHPVVLRAGKPLFDGMSKALNLELTAKRNFNSGVVKLYYRPQSRIHNYYQ